MKPVKSPPLTAAQAKELRNVISQRFNALREYLQSTRVSYPYPNSNQLQNWEASLGSLLKSADPDIKKLEPQLKPIFSKIVKMNQANLKAYHDHHNKRSAAAEFLRETESQLYLELAFATGAPGTILSKVPTLADLKKLLA